MNRTQSTRGRGGSAKKPATPRKETVASVPLADVLIQLQETRSILAVAVRALDEIEDPRRADAPEECASNDVSVVLRVGIERLRRAHEALDSGKVEPTVARQARP